MLHTILICIFIILSILNSGLMVYQLMNPEYTKMFPLQVKTIVGLLFVILTFLIQLTSFPNHFQELFLTMSEFVISIFNSLAIVILFSVPIREFLWVFFMCGSHRDTVISHFVNIIWYLLGVFVWWNNIIILIGLCIFSLNYAKYLRQNKYFS